eukprot:m.185014 g.185014  ORF g.185014 m.185014 type:complete len:612 (-) comp16312_c0_seq1:65-1900(-)
MAALSPREVFTKCVAVLKSYETSLIGPDAHVVQFLSDEKLVNEDDVDFITDVFLGCVRFAKMIDVVINGFLSRDGRNFLLNDRPMLRVTAYMAIVVVAATGVDVLEAMLFAQPRVTLGKIAAFLRFGWANDALDTWVREKWCTLYDEAYVEEQLLGPLDPHRDDIAVLCEKIDRKLANVTTPTTTAKPTVPQPFNLTQPKVKSIEPVPLNTTSVKVPVPDTTYKSPIEQQALERQRRRNREKAQKTLQQANEAISPHLTASGESERTKALRAELREREEAELRVKIRAKALPRTTDEAELAVKLNTVAILREENRIRSDVKAEHRRLKAVEAGGFDREAYNELERDLAAEEAARHDADVQVRHLQGLIAREDRELSKEAHAAQSRKTARQIRDERRELQERIALERQADEVRNKKKVESAAQLQERMLRAKAAVTEQKAEIVKEVAATNRALLEEAAAREAAEKEERAAVIREIRALQMSFTDRAVKMVDMTETSGCGFLTEMSYIELQERLAMLRVHKVREEEERRAQIARDKAEAERALNKKLQTIAHARAARQAAGPRNPGRTLSARRRGAAQDPRVAALQAQLDAKRGAVRSRKAKSARPVAQPASY